MSGCTRSKVHTAAILQRPCIRAQASSLYCTPAAEAEPADTESDPLVYDYDQDYVDRKYELLSLKVIHRRRRTGFEETKDFPIRVNDLVAGRYQVDHVA